MPEKELSDALILAALERAERHLGRESPGVGYVEVIPHLGLRMSAAVGRRARPRFRELEAAGLIAGVKAHGAVKYTATRRGQRLLREAGEVALPESPQHRCWRQAREQAEQRIGGFRAEVGALLGEAATALAKDTTDSEAWFTLGEKLGRACWRLGSATHCLREWPEPSDDAMDVDAGGRSGRRDTTLWRS